ncbi:hypothetical protein [Ekhidna sp.]|uniref:hypothetical protein n=1 Tax=Ekhidna sp. TaxID=2608089 RepID=UPI0032978CF8
MKIGSIKLALMLALSLHYILASAQPSTDFVHLRQSTSENKAFELVLNRLTTYDRVISESFSDWCLKRCEKRRYIGITHTPSSDFNIYLTINNSLTPKIKTSLEVSLNYTGVMNIRSLILLGKKGQKD